MILQPQLLRVGEPGPQCHLSTGLRASCRVFIDIELDYDICVVNGRDFRRFRSGSGSLKRGLSDHGGVSMLCANLVKPWI